MKVLLSLLLLMPLLATGQSTLVVTARPPSIR